MFEQVTRLRLSVESDGVDKAKRELGGLGKAGKATEQSLEGTNKTTKVLSKSLIGLGLSVGSVALAAKKVLGDWSRFNNAMLEVETIAGSTKAEMKSLRLEALRLAQSLGVDAADAAGGFYQAISAGVATEDVAQFTKVAAQLAKGGLSDVASSTDLLTTALNAYKIEASEAESISDKLFKTVQLGKTNIPQLASSFGRAATAAAQSGVDINELLGIVAETTKQGVKTAEVFTMVKAAITALLNPSEDMAAIFEQLGVQSGRELIAARGLAVALDAVRSATAGNDAVTVKALRSVEAFSLAMSTTGTNLDLVKKSTEQVTKALGDTKRASETTSETVGVAFKKLGNSFLILSENIIKSIDADLKFGAWVSSVADTLADEEVGKAFGQSLQNFFTLGVSSIARYREEVKKTAQQEEQLERLREASALRMESRQRSFQGNINARLELQKKIEDAEKRIEEIYEGRNRTRLPENLLLERRELDKQIELYKERQKIIEDTITASGTFGANIAAKQGEEIKKINKQLLDGKITEEERNRLVQEINDRYKQILQASIETEKVLQAKIKATKDWGKASYDALQNILGITTGSEVNLGIIKKQQKESATQIEINKILKQYEDDKLEILEKQIQAFEDKIADNKILTTQEQKILDFLRKQLGILQEQTKEKEKSKELTAFEALERSQLTDKEEAALAYRKALEEINQVQLEGADAQERKDKARARALSNYLEALTRAELSQIPKATEAPEAIDLQEGINTEAQRISERYMSEIELLRQHEAEKLAIIEESTNLSEERKKEIQLAIQADTNAQIAQIEQAQFQERLGLASDFFGNLASVASAFGKKGAKAAKAFAIAQATIDTYASAVAAYKSTVGIPVVGPALAPVAAAGAIAAGLAQIAAIRSQNVEGNYQQGGIVGGTLYGGDQQLARVNSGEMILNKTQQGRLFELANNPLGGADKKSGGNVTIVNNAPIQLQGEVENTQEGDMRIIIDEAVQQTKNELTNEAQEGGGTFFPAFEQSYGIARK